MWGKTHSPPNLDVVDAFDHLIASDVIVQAVTLRIEKCRTRHRLGCQSFQCVRPLKVVIAKQRFIAVVRDLGVALRKRNRGIDAAWRTTEKRGVKRVFACLVADIWAIDGIGRSRHGGCADSQDDRS